MMHAPSELRRLERLVPSVIDGLDLDLSGLTVLTEAASGPYLATPVLAAAAGARRVYAVAADSRYHAAGDVATATREFAARLGVGGALVVLLAKTAEALAEADIVTNTGAVRPIDAATVCALKPTAVVCLMWETWEFLPEQVDLERCRVHGTLVLGTNEHREPCDLRPYAGMTAVKLLLELGLEGYRSRILLLGRQPTLGQPIETVLRSLGCDVTTFSRAEEGGLPYGELAAHVATAREYDAVIVADHMTEGPLLADQGPLRPATLLDHSPAIRVGLISGQVDVDALATLGVPVLPFARPAPRTMAYSLAELGPRPVLELYAAGLKVGQVAARARLAGLDVDRARSVALAGSPAMAFAGDPP